MLVFSLLLWPRSRPATEVLRRAYLHAPGILPACAAREEDSPAFGLTVERSTASCNWPAQTRNMDIHAKPHQEARKRSKEESGRKIPALTVPIAPCVATAAAPGQSAGPVRRLHPSAARREHRLLTRLGHPAESTQAPCPPIQIRYLRSRMPSRAQVDRCASDHPRAEKVSRSEKGWSILSATAPGTASQLGSWRHPIAENDGGDPANQRTGTTSLLPGRGAIQLRCLVQNCLTAWLKNIMFPQFHIPCRWLQASIGTPLPRHAFGVYSHLRFDR